MKKMIYEPSEDSYLIEEFVKKYSKGKKVLDMGSGSGILALAALNSGAKNVLAIDIDLKTVRELKKKGLNALVSDLFENIKERFDLIIFNPPYLPEDKREDRESARITSGGKRGDEIILRFLKDAKEHLNKNGIILLTLSNLTPDERIEKLVKKKRLKKRVLGRKRLFMEELEIWEIR